MPEEMDADDIEEVVNSSESIAGTELRGGRQQVLNPLFNQQADPASGGRISQGNLAILKGRFPHLGDFSDSFLMARTPDELLKIESTSQKLRDAERGRELEDRLHSYKTTLAMKTTEVMAGVDNRWTILHSARFIGGAACTAQERWSQARTVIGINGNPPLSNFDN
jgi:hypothetical protein